MIARLRTSDFVIWRSSVNVVRSCSTDGDNVTRVFAEYNFASGDDDPTDGDVGYFEDLFQTAY